MLQQNCAIGASRIRASVGEQTRKPDTRLCSHMPGCWQVAQGDRCFGNPATVVIDRRPVALRPHLSMGLPFRSALVFPTSFLLHSGEDCQEVPRLVDNLLDLAR